MLDTFPKIKSKMKNIMKKKKKENNEIQNRLCNDFI